MWNCTISELATIQRNITSLLTLPSTKVLVRIIFDLISHGFAVVAQYQKGSEMFSKSENPEFQLRDVRQARYIHCECVHFYFSMR